MTRKSTDPRKTQVVTRLLEGHESRIAEPLPEALASQSNGGESIFTTALRSATPDHLERARTVTGLIDSKFYIRCFQKTRNPLCLWLSISDLTSPGDIPPETFSYLQKIAQTFFKEILDQLQSLEHVRITPGQEVQEGVAHVPRTSPPLPNISDILGLAQPGRNPFQAMARELRAWSAATAVDDLVRRTGCNQEQAYAILATALGRISPETGPSTEHIRKLVGKGKKLFPRRSKRPPG